jgi:hypothetical protein
MENFKVTDLLPKKADFYLSIPDKTFTLRPCTPKDLIDLKGKGLDVENILKNPISADVCKVILFLMEFEDAQFFMKKELKTVDIETGDVQVEDVGGYNLLLKFVASIKEQMEMFFSMLVCMGFDQLSLNEMKKQVYETELDDKKKVTLSKKKMRKIKKA